MIQNTKMNLQRHFTKAGNASINTYIILKNTTQQTLRVPPGGWGAEAETNAAQTTDLRSHGREWDPNSSQ